MTLWTVALVSVSVVLLLVLFKRRRGRLPPGPWGMPVLGALPFWKGPETNLEWARRYGPVYSYRAGPVLIVYLDKIELVKKYLEDGGENFIDRPAGPAAIANGVLFGSGEAWRLNRRLLSKAFWVGEDMASKLEEAITPLLATVLDSLSASSLSPTADQGSAGRNTAVTISDTSQGVLVGEVFLPFVTNLLSTLIRGQSYRPDDPELSRITALLSDAAKIDLTSLKTLVSLKKPALRRFLANGTPDLHELSALLQEILRGWVSQHQEARRRGQGRENPRDCIDEFLDSSEYAQINNDDKEQIQSLLDVYYGGMASILSEVEFLFLYLLHHPDVARRVQEEVAEVTGGERTPRWEDRHTLTFTRCVLLETHRLGSVTPSCLPHVAVKDCQVEGFNVPAGAHVKTSHYVLHRDPDHFLEPERFRPERHLDAEGKVKVPESFRPFGIGARLCPGELLADMTLFLTLTAVLQRYDVTSVGSVLPPFSASMRVVRRLAPYKAVFTPRA